MTMITAIRINVHRLIAISCWLITYIGYGQTGKLLTLDTCYAIAKQQYPMIKQKGLIEKSRQYNVQNASRGYLPTLSFNGQATYQDPVTAINFTLPKPFSISFPTFNHDQYKAYGEIDQVIYDGGNIHNQKLQKETDADIQEQNLEVNLYAIKERVNQIYFGTLLIDEQIKLNELVQKDIQSSVDKIQASVTNGAALQSSMDELEAELMQQQQNHIELQSSRKSYISMLGLFINQPLEESTRLQKPNEIQTANTIKRPELSLYDEQKKSYDVQDKMLTSGNLPRLSFFFQGGYGRPGLNAFDNTFEPYYIGGFRFSWTLGGLYTIKNQRQLLNIERQTLDVEKETFLFNTNLTLKQQSEEIIKLQQLIAKDNDIIAKRTSVKVASKVQLENGVITTHEYLNELVAEEQAKQNLIVHNVQLLMAEYNYQNTSGN